MRCAACRGDAKMLTCVVGWAPQREADATIAEQAEHIERLQVVAFHLPSHAFAVRSFGSDVSAWLRAGPAGRDIDAGQRQDVLGRADRRQRSVCGRGSAGEGGGRGGKGATGRVHAAEQREGDHDPVSACPVQVLVAGLFVRWFGLFCLGHAYGEWCRPFRCGTCCGIRLTGGGGRVQGVRGCTSAVGWQGAAGQQGQRRPLCMLSTDFASCTYTIQVPAR